MKKTFSAGTCSAIIAAATISVLAQNPPAQSPNPPPQTTTSTSAEHRITVTGCLKPASAAATDTTTAAQQPPSTVGTSGTTAPSNAPSDSNARFVLSSATISPAETDPAANPNTASAAGTTTPPTGKESAQTYRLLANPVALSPHVGKKLELIGTVIDDATARTLTSTDQGSPATGPLLRVEAGKIVAATCQD
jgi:hypothetical protein